MALAAGEEQTLIATNLDRKRDPCFIDPVNFRMLFQPFENKFAVFAYEGVQFIRYVPSVSPAFT